MTIEEFDELYEHLCMLGYRPYIDPGDRAIVLGDPCETCGHTHEYYGLKKGDSYRAFSQCESCDEAHEF